MIKRYLFGEVSAEIVDKMVFISGPRQVGKTTFALNLAEKLHPGGVLYLNWDDRKDRKNILDERFESGKKIIIFDEIHKYRDWKNYLKGVYDKNRGNFKIIVTGSARLDVYKKGGDSLLGRYSPYRLNPLSVGELNGGAVLFTPFKELAPRGNFLKAAGETETLLKFGGFPEIYLKRSDKALRQWHNRRTDLLIKEDIRDIRNIREISLLQVLVELLPGRVGSLLSVNSLAEDLSVNYRTAALWLDILEQFYYHFRVYPYQNSRIKALKKESKLYLWDWSELKDEPAKFENFIASHLLKFCHYLFDAEGFKTHLYYLRDREGREADFLVAVDNNPWFAVEVKSSSKNVSSSLRYFSEKLEIPFSFQVIKEANVDFTERGIRVISAGKFLTMLP